MRGRWIAGVAFGVAAALLARTAPAAAEEGTVNAVSAWQGQGRFYRVAKEQAFFVGAFSGMLFVETRQGDLDAAKLLCPATMELDVRSGAQSAEGRCVITTRGGDQVFGRFRCAGSYGGGCAGRFELTGGTGKLERITGGGDFLIRSAISELAGAVQNETVQETAAGLAVWPALRYRIP